MTKKKVILDGLTDEEIIEFAQKYGYNMTRLNHHHIGHTSIEIIPVTKENIEFIELVYFTKKSIGSRETIHLSGS